MDVKVAFILSLVVCVVFTACFILVRSKGASVFSVLTKSIASFCFIMCLMVSLIYTKVFNEAYICLALGLVCGLIGDVLLDLKLVYKEHDNEYLRGGFVSFGIGHVFYTLALVLFAGQYGIDLLVPLLVAVGAGIVLTIGTYFLTKMMKMDFGKNLVITLVYTFILNFITVLAIVLAIYNTAFISLAVGFVFFLISDLVLSMQYFGGKADSNILQVINHSTYYIAQILIASTAFILILI